MPHLRWTCPACRHFEETPGSVLLERLRGLGLLKRATAQEAKDLNYLLQLAQSVRHELACPKCSQPGFLPEMADENGGESWGDARKCSRCEALISPERLEVFPGATLCQACQRKEERGESEVVEYCPRCGTPMQVRPRRGGGIAGYELVCPSCGERRR